MNAGHHSEATLAALPPASTGTAAQRAAAEIRGLMGARKLGPADLAPILGLSPSTAARRFNGEITLNINELEAVASWLDVPITRIIAPADGAPFGK